MTSSVQVMLTVGRCRQCSFTQYPERSGGCSRCGSTEATTELIDGSGTVWTFTVQRYAPKSPPFVHPPTGFRPFAVAYVETADGLRVAGIVETDPDAVRIGSRVGLISVDDVPRYRLLPVEG